MIPQQQPPGKSKGGFFYMRLPTVIISDELANFGKRFERDFIRDKHGTLKLTTRADGPARRYELRQDAILLAEIDALPLGNELEIQIARPTSEDGGICEAVYAWINSTYTGKCRFTNQIDRATWPLQFLTAGLLETITAPAADDTADDKILRQGFSAIAGGGGLPAIKEKHKPKANRKWTEDDKADAQERYERVKSEIEKGESVERACHFAGISKATYYNHKKRFDSV